MKTFHRDVRVLATADRMTTNLKEFYQHAVLAIEQTVGVLYRIELSRGVKMLRKCLLSGFHQRQLNPPSSAQTEMTGTDPDLNTEQQLQNLSPIHPQNQSPKHPKRWSRLH